MTACVGAGPLDIVVLYTASERLTKGEPQDMLSELGIASCAAAVAEALRDDGHRVAMAPLKADVESALAPYPTDQWVVFNLGEGVEGRLFEEVRIAWTLEARGYRFTGADGPALAISTHKGRAKAALATAGVLTPGWRLFRHPGEVTEEAAEGLPFPLFVKPVAEDGSIGIGSQAVVADAAGLRRRVSYIFERYQQMALAEQFIAGREFNVALWGQEPDVLPLAEIDFGAFERETDRIVTYAAKWEVESFEYVHTPAICPARVSAELGERIRRTARLAWSAIGGRGYGRVDLRVPPTGVPYVIEVNCNPDISPDAGFFRAAQAAGYEYRTMVSRILEMAYRRS